MWIATETRGNAVARVECVTYQDAAQWVEDRAVELWSATIDPNDGSRPVYPGLWFHCEANRVVSWINAEGFETQWIVVEEKP